MLFLFVPKGKQKELYMKEVKKKKGVLDDNTVITLGNIEKLSQCFALSALKSIKKYAYSATPKVERLQSQLRQDICYHKKLDTCSDAYDLVQEASLFLCKFIGHKLGELCKDLKSKSGEIDNLKNACIRVLQVYLRKELKFSNNTVDEEECLELASDKSVIEEKPDYTKVKEILSKIIQNKFEYQVFEYYYNGVEPKLIAEFLGISVDRVYRRRRKFKDRYAMYYL